MCLLHGSTGAMRDQPTTLIGLESLELTRGTGPGAVSFPPLPVYLERAGGKNLASKMTLSRKKECTSVGEGGIPAAGKRDGREFTDGRDCCGRKPAQGFFLRKLP